jgi:hypothetical protein
MSNIEEAFMKYFVRKGLNSALDVVKHFRSMDDHDIPMSLCIPYKELTALKEKYESDVNSDPKKKLEFNEFIARFASSIAAEASSASASESGTRTARYSSDPVRNVDSSADQPIKFQRRAHASNQSVFNEKKAGEAAASARSFLKLQDIDDMCFTALKTLCLTLSLQKVVQATLGKSVSRLTKANDHTRLRDMLVAIKDGRLNPALDNNSLSTAAVESLRQLGQKRISTMTITALKGLYTTLGLSAYFKEQSDKALSNTRKVDEAELRQILIDIIA